MDNNVHLFLVIENVIISYMILSIDDIERLAKLARIKLSNEEKEKFGEQMSSILDYVDQIKEVDTSMVKEKTHLKGLNNAFRNDQVTASCEVKKSIDQFPDKAGNLNKVKAVMD